MDHLLACSVVLCQYNYINSLLTEFYIKTEDVVNESLATFNGSPEKMKSSNRIKKQTCIYTVHDELRAREVISKIVE